jgi:hypothetical protein
MQEKYQRNAHTEQKQYNHPRKTQQPDGDP